MNDNELYTTINFRCNACGNNSRFRIKLRQTDTYIVRIACKECGFRIKLRQTDNYIVRIACKECGRYQEFIPNSYDQFDTEGLYD